MTSTWRCRRVQTLREGDDGPYGRAEDDHPRRISWLDARRLRLLPFDLFAQGHRQGVRRRGPGRGLRALPDLGDAVRRRVHLRPARRSVGPQARPDARHSLLFDPRRACCFLAKPHDLSDPARFIRRRHGRRMGPRQLAGDGIHSAAGARTGFRDFPMRLSMRLPARRDRLWPALWPHVRRLHSWLARDVPAQRPACPARAVHPQRRSRIASVRSLEGACKPNLWATISDHKGLVST